MEIEVQVDRMAYRRNRRGSVLFGLTIVLYFPVAVLAFHFARTVLGREAGPDAGTVILTGLVAVTAAFLHSTWHSFSYRCPQCGRRLSKVVPQGEYEPHIHYHCPDCRIVWDLGWGWVSGGGVGG